MQFKSLLLNNKGDSMRMIGLLLLLLTSFGFAGVLDFTVRSHTGDTINLYEHLDKGQYVLVVATNYN